MCPFGGGYPSGASFGNIFRLVGMSVLLGWWVLLVFFFGLWFGCVVFGVDISPDVVADVNIKLI